MRKKLSKLEAIHKLHQLQKRIKRGNDNKGHTSKLKIRKRLKQISELRKTIFRYNR